MKVGELKQILGQFPDNTEVVITAGWDDASEGGGHHVAVAELQAVCRATSGHDRPLCELITYENGPIQ